MNTRPQKNGVPVQLNRNTTEARANSNMGVIYGIGEEFKILTERNKIVTTGKCKGYTAYVTEIIPPDVNKRAKIMGHF